MESEALLRSVSTVGTKFSKIQSSFQSLVALNNTWVDLRIWSEPSLFVAQDLIPLQIAQKLIMCTSTMPSVMFYL